MHKKILLGTLLLAINASAAVFDYRFYYGDTTSTDTGNVLAYSANVYSYFNDSDIAYGVQIDYSKVRSEPDTKITSFSGLIGYDLTRTWHGEVDSGISMRYKNGTYKKGYHGALTLLIQSNFDSFLESLQFGVTAKYDYFEGKVKNELGTQIFIGLGF